MRESGEMEWWTKNPQLFKDDGKRYFALSDGDVRASLIWAVSYDDTRSGHALVLFSFQYATQAAASADYERFKKDRDKSQISMGFMRGRRDTFILLGVDNGSPDRDFFVKYFSGLVDAVE